MRRAGRVSPLLLLFVLGIAAVAFLVLFGKEGPGAAGSRFMDALARGDVDALVKNSFVSGKSDAELRKDWEFATQVAGKHYLFIWTPNSAREVDANNADVRIQVQRNVDSGSSYDENYGLTLQKRDGVWKVDAGAISREMYPGLPRAGRDTGTDTGTDAKS